MTRRSLATISSVFGLVLGGIGLVVPATLAGAFGVTLDGVAVELARLACAAYVGFGVLTWLARDVDDPIAWHAVAAGNLTGWGLSGVVAALALASGYGTGTTWIILVLQVVFAAAWLASLVNASPARMLHESVARR